MTKYRGAVAACGLAAGMDLPSSVAPFYFTRRVSVGHRFVMCPIELRKTAWSRLAGDLDRTKLAEITHEIGLDGLSMRAPKSSPAGPGRIVVKFSNVVSDFTNQTCSNVATVGMVSSG